MRSQAPRGAGFLLRGCPGRPGLASLPGGAGFHWLEYDAGACSFFITGDPGVRCARPPGRPPPTPGWRGSCWRRAPAEMARG